MSVIPAAGRYELVYLIRDGGDWQRPIAKLWPIIGWTEDGKAVIGHGTISEEKYMVINTVRDVKDGMFYALERRVTADQIVRFYMLTGKLTNQQIADMELRSLPLFEYSFENERTHARKQLRLNDDG